MFFLFATLQDVMQKNKSHPVLGEVLAFHKRWNKGNFKATKDLKKSTPKGYEHQAKRLLEKELETIKSIKYRNQPNWTDKVWDFFGTRTTQKRHSVNWKLVRLEEFLEYALCNFDRLNSLKLDHSDLGTGIYPQDMMTKHDALALKIILLFQKTAAKQDISYLDNTPVLYRFDTQGFDLSGSIFSQKDGSFRLPHNGYILSGQREQATRHRWGPEDCTTLVIKYFPEIPELGFSTLIIWKWLDNDLLGDPEWKKYHFMADVLNKTFERVDQFKPGYFLLIEGHIWYVLGKEGNQLHVMNYTRQNAFDEMNGFVITTLDWEAYKKERPKYTILKPRI